MATDMERLVVSLEARTKAFENSLNKANAQSQRQLRAIESRFAAANKNVTSSLSGMAKGFAGAFAGTAAIQGAQKLIDASTRITNALKVAGLQGDELDKVYGRLFQSAQKNSAPLESLVTLYGRVAQSQDSLGVSQEQMLSFTDKIGVALRVAGADAQSASGALLQLSQALGAGTVRAEEFNSINEGARPILQAVAAGLKEAGGSVSTLRALVLEGKVSSEAFFRAFEAGAGILEDKVAGAALTTEQAFTKLSNTLIDIARKFDDATDASGRLAGFLSDDLASAIEEAGGLFTTAAQGANEFIGVINRVTDAVVGLSAKLGQVSGLDQIGKSLGATPYQSEAFRRRSEGEIKTLIDGLEADLMQARAAGSAVAGMIEGQLNELYEDLASVAGGGPATRGRRGRGSAAVSAPVSIVDYPAGPASAGGGSGGVSGSNSGGMTAEMIKQFEGFRNKPYYDVNAYRVGYGSDTVTLADGSIQKVTQGMRVSVADANRDLIRRVDEFQATVKGQIGGETFGRMNEQQQAALTSIAYNYGSLPERIVDAIRTGNAATVESAIRGLGNDNNGVNYGRRNAEADLFAGVNVANIDAAKDAWAGVRDVTVETKAETAAVSKEYEVFGQIAQTALTGLATALADGKITGQELLSIIIQIAQQLLSMPSIGGSSGGGIAGFLGSIFGFEKGGVAAYGRPVPLRKFARGGVAKTASIFGEAGPEAAVPLPDGRRIPVDLRGPTGGGGSAETIRLVLQDDSGRMAEIADQRIQTSAGTIIQISTQQSVKAVKQQMPGLMSDAQSRTG